MQVGALGGITYQLVNSANEQIYLASRRMFNKVYSFSLRLTIRCLFRNVNYQILLNHNAVNCLLDIRKGHHIFISDTHNKKIMTIRTESNGCPVGFCCCFTNWCDFCAVRMSIQAYEGRRIGYLVQK